MSEPRRYHIRRAVRRYIPSTRYLDKRLGSGNDDRPPIHERLDRIEIYLSHLAEQNDKTIRELQANVGRLEVTILANLAAVEDSLDALADRLARGDVSGTRGPAGREWEAWDEGASAAIAAFAVSSLAALDRPARLLATGTGAAPIALGLAGLGHELVLDDASAGDLPAPPNVRVVASVEIAVDESARYDAAFAAIAADGTGPSGSARRDAIDWISSRVEAGGILVLSIPIGGDAFLPDGPDGLPEGWSVTRHDAIWRTEGDAWAPGSPREPLGDAGIALIAAVRNA